MSPVYHMAVRCVVLTIVLGSGFSRLAMGADVERPRLMVLVVFDQLRGDYLARWESHFSDGGFRRLQNEGAWFQNCHYPYAGTLTGAGHASLLTGCSPVKHGIVSNEWFDRTLGKSVNCVYSLRHERVPSVADAAQQLLSPAKDSGKVSPQQMMSPSFSDVLKDGPDSKSRVVALSLKDRSAALPGGHRPDACYWLDAETGEFITSTYYRDELHPWVAEFNRSRVIDQWFGQEWTRARQDIDYQRVIGPDDMVGEGSGVKQGRVFPHAMNGGLAKPGPASYKAVYTSPFGNELLLALAKRAVDAEELGRRDAPDLLTISFSSNDAIGHSWGPDSQEVFDVTLRSDQIVKELLDYLDAKVGKGRYMLALTADHGVCSVPEVAAAQGKDAGRLSSTVILKGANEYLSKKFGGKADEKTRWVQLISNNWCYLHPATIAEHRVKQEDVELALGEWLVKQHGISRTFSRQHLRAETSSDDPQEQAVLRSFYPERCGDVLIVMQPNWLLGDSTTGTTHGSPHSYDSHVPLLFFGPQVAAKRHTEKVSPLSIAATFAKALNIAVPGDSQTPVPAGLFMDESAK